ncbi:MAG: hypothetical protein K6E30_08560, partial [Lachnospiraceae bacterium]|nr:hypothetical protein [Lachnospiraceae bacterium]
MKFNYLKKHFIVLGITGALVAGAAATPVLATSRSSVNQPQQTLAQEMEAPAEGERPALPEGVEAPAEGERPALPEGVEAPAEGERPALPEGVEAPARKRLPALQKGDEAPPRIINQAVQ